MLQVEGTRNKYLSFSYTLVTRAEYSLVPTDDPDALLHMLWTVPGGNRKQRAIIDERVVETMDGTRRQQGRAVPSMDGPWREQGPSRAMCAAMDGARREPGSEPQTGNKERVIQRGQQWTGPGGNSEPSASAAGDQWTGPGGNRSKLQEEARNV